VTVVDMVDATVTVVDTVAENRTADAAAHFDIVFVVQTKVEFDMANQRFERPVESERAHC
jgi:hypothetical protein